jgi:hypothetical protein
VPNYAPEILAAAERALTVAAADFGHGDYIAGSCADLARAALDAAAPLLAESREPFRFAAVTDAINAIAARVNLPLDLAADLVKAIDACASDRAARAVSAERERCAADRRSNDRR